MNAIRPTSNPDRTRTCASRVAAVWWRADSDVSKREMRLIAMNKEMGIADVLSARQNVGWDWSGTDEGEHTGVHVPVFAYGPGADVFGALNGADNEEVGVLLLEAISN